jgi:hypothetical protein
MLPALERPPQPPPALPPVSAGRQRPAHLSQGALGAGPARGSPPLCTQPAGGTDGVRLQRQRRRRRRGWRRAVPEHCHGAVLRAADSRRRHLHARTAGENGEGILNRERAARAACATPLPPVPRQVAPIELDAAPSRPLLYAAKLLPPPPPAPRIPAAPAPWPPAPIPAPVPAPAPAPAYPVYPLYNVPGGGNSYSPPGRVTAAAAAAPGGPPAWAGGGAHGISAASWPPRGGVSAAPPLGGGAPALSASNWPPAAAAAAAPRAASAAVVGGTTPQSVAGAAAPRPVAVAFPRR